MDVGRRVRPGEGAQPLAFDRAYQGGEPSGNFLLSGLQTCGEFDGLRERSELAPTRRLRQSGWLLRLVTQLDVKSAPPGLSKAEGC